jgi:leukotriene-A4 hydrolase
MQDPNSFSNHHQVAVQHLDLQLTTDFEKKVLSGYVDLTCQVLVDSPSHLVLDTSHLTINEVVFVDKDNTASLKVWTLMISFYP